MVEEHWKRDVRANACMCVKFVCLVYIERKIMPVVVCVCCRRSELYMLLPVKSIKNGEQRILFVRFVRCFSLLFHRNVFVVAVFAWLSFFFCSFGRLSLPFFRSSDVSFFFFFLFFFAHPSRALVKIYSVLVVVVRWFFSEDKKKVSESLPIFQLYAYRFFRLNFFFRWFVAAKILPWFLLLQFRAKPKRDSTFSNI